MAPTPPAAEPPATKAALVVQAARRLFMERGYGATSMDAVALEAGVSKATLYAHFASKAELFSAIVAAECHRFVPTLDESEVDHLPVREALTRIGRRFLDLLISPPALSAYRVVIAEALRFPELGRAFYDAGPATTLSVLAGYLDRATRRGDLAVKDPVTAASLLVGMFRSHLQLRILLGVVDGVGDAERDHHVRAAVDLFLDGYGLRG
ncbi:MAG: TetR/AcrR family transcriptional regulator [Rhodospirillaceae bacterium]